VLIYLDRYGESSLVIKAYLDGSGSIYDQYISLAGIVSSEANWPEFENHWMSVLKSYSLREFHMSAAMMREKQFKD
jgi:hypothetical protein